MRSRNMRQIIFCLTALLAAVVLAQTPVIGGICKLGTADVQIGGKQTQFFLKCEPTSDSQNGEGVWVVKSRIATPAPTAPVENTQQNMAPPRKNANPNICEQDNGARENEGCSVSATCLQANNGYPTTYLQCDQTTMRWMRKSCQETFIFNFEQQTCVVPKRVSHVNHPCPDGSTPRFKCPCPSGHTCTAQRHCCPNRITCMKPCSNTKPCPNGMVCSKTTSCCEPKHHLARSDTTEIFMGDSSIFDMEGKQIEKIPPQPPNGFKVMSGPMPQSNRLDMKNEHEWSMPARGLDAAVEALPPESRPPAEQPPVADRFLGSTEDRQTTSRNISPIEELMVTSTSPPLMACRGTNAVCDYNTDCPSSFTCENNCCRLEMCPNQMKVQYTCTSNYQCGSGESCLFGGCCLRRPLTSTSIATTIVMPTRMLRTEKAPITTTLAPMAVIDPEPEFASNQDVDPYSEMAATEIPVTSTRMTSMMPSFGPKDVCEVDNRVSNCNMASPCPETSECLFGSCCRVTPRTCANGLPALTVPDICSEADECPIASVCEQGRCCPTDNAAEDLPLPKSFSEQNSLKSVEISKKKKTTCLVSQTCSSIILCPPEYTCSSNGECCQMNVTCPDGTVPETVCGKDQLCPSSVHSCMQLGTESVCCPNTDKGQQTSSGLVCTFSSCSNNNPCSSGTCNNGYCCSTGGAPAPIMDSNATVNITSTDSTSNSTSTLTTTPQAETNTTQEVLKDQEDWPVGPPGYGFPEHLADLDSVLVPAQGDGNSCSGGYKSNLACSLGGECPPGLFCDRLMDRCCPMVLPLTDTRNPSRVQLSRRPVSENDDESIEEEYRDRKRSYRSFGHQGSPCCPFQANPGCNGCQQQAAPMIAVASCPGGAYSVGNCNSGFCSPGYQCIQNSCCPQYAPQPSIRVYSCPSGGNAVGACIAGSCSTGYSCVQGNCCPARETKNPFVCPDGTQAVGGCVNGQCGAGYRCSNGLCCAGTSTTVKCLDGSEAVGACIPSCQGDACGRTTVSYYCGSGYTCTTGNICCAVNSCPDGGDVLGPTVNGLCPTGYVAQGSICCSAALCPDGSASTPAINGLCPTTLTLTNGVCCAGAVAPLTCSADISVGPCNPDGSCQVGYRCDSAGETCCPVVNIVDPQYQLGPSVAGLCPAGYAVVYLPPLAADGEGVCIDLQSIPGVCAVDAQSGPCSNGQCPTGFSCFVEADVCCPPTAVFRKLRPGAKATKVGSRPTYGRPLHSYMPPRTMGGPLSCPDGNPAGGACMNGLCGVGHECIEGLCCPPQSKYGSVGTQGSQDLKSTCPGGETAVSGCFADGTCGIGYECVKHMNLCCEPGSNTAPSTIPAGPSFPGQPATSVRPIGARCMQDGECVGNNEGLSMCHAGVCQCSPIAYSQGIACIRRKAMQMMMNDSPVMDSEVEKAVEKNLVAPLPTA